MTAYLVLLRGINVGGKNTVPMAKLRTMLEALGFTGVSTYIASGNAIVSSTAAASTVASRIEEALPRHFDLDTEVIRVKVLTAAQLRKVVEDRPDGFGDAPDTFTSDVIFLMDVPPKKALAAFAPREGVDTIWPGDGVIYSQRLTAERTKSRLNKVLASPLYQSMTIRNWNTTTTLLALLEAAGHGQPAARPRTQGR